MAFKLSDLYNAPSINPRNNKALSIPLLNLKSKYGRVFHLSWLSFFVSFLSWFAFPPLLPATIKKDLNLKSEDIANNNICGLCATLLARLVLGPLCDRFGPRWVMCGLLIIGAVPTAFASCVTNVAGLHAIRFFIGLLGGSFVPCQVWTTLFFDKSIVGTANALAGGWGNSGGGVAFFMMPGLAHDLALRGFSQHRSWGLAFVVGPMIILLFVAFLIALFGVDSPEGKWSHRSDILGIGIDVTSTEFITVPIGTATTTTEDAIQFSSDGNKVESEESFAEERKEIEAEAEADQSRSYDDSNSLTTSINDHDQRATVMAADLVSVDEVIKAPTFMDFFIIGFHWRTMVVCLAYFSTFGAELAIESVMSAVYMSHLEGGSVTERTAGGWASMLGLLNIISRPVGGIISDFLYARYRNIMVKKYWMVICGTIEGIFLLWIGQRTPTTSAALIVSMTVMDLFMEMGNGANFSLVPHIFSAHTGIVMGTTGAFGNLGGIFFSLIFRYQVINGKTDFMRGFWILGIVILGLNFIIAFIPLKDDKGQLGGQRRQSSARTVKVV